MFVYFVLLLLLAIGVPLAKCHWDIVIKLFKIPFPSAIASLVYVRVCYKRKKFMVFEVFFYNLFSSSHILCYTVWNSFRIFFYNIFCNFYDSIDMKINFYIFYRKRFCQAKYKFNSRKKNIVVKAKSCDNLI
jgi:hypothetical protein